MEVLESVNHSRLGSCASGYLLTRRAVRDASESMPKYLRRHFEGFLFENTLICPHERRNCCRSSGEEAKLYLISDFETRVVVDAPGACNGWCLADLPVVDYALQARPHVTSGAPSQKVS